MCKIVLCLGYTWIRIPISPLFGTFLADICLFFCRLLVDFCQGKMRSNSLFVIFFSDLSPWFFVNFSDFFFLFCQFARHSDLIRKYPDYLADVLISFSKNWRKKRQFFAENLLKKCQKSADSSKNRNPDPRLARPLIFLWNYFCDA